METVDGTVLLAILQGGPRGDAGCALLQRCVDEGTRLRVHVWTVVDLAVTLEGVATGGTAGFLDFHKAIGGVRAQVAADLASLLSHAALEVSDDVLEALAVYGKYRVPCADALGAVHARGDVIWSWRESEVPGAWRAPT